MKKKSWNRIFIEAVSEKPIAFLPVLAHVVDSASAGLFMSQLLYWWGKGRLSGWIYKTIEEVKIETCMTRSEQNTAFKKWERLGVLEKRLKGIPPKRHFRINTDKLAELVREAKHNVENGKTSHQNQRHITENTHRFHQRI